MIGTVLDGRYRILKRLGAGGMGEVYLGEHLVLKRKEAVKVLKSRFAKDEGHLARFRREARATNRVQHPNIVGFYDFGKLPDGRLYLTMEFADGPNLQEVLRSEGRFEPGRAVSILRQLAAAIHFAHSKGVIHRDLKPQNLILTQATGHPDMIKILDFGVAKITAPGYLENFAISMEGQLFGTPAYVAPEQIRGVRDDHRIDLYALGCIGYELLTGETPFVGRPMAVLEAHMSDMPKPPSARCPDAGIPAELDAIILSCLTKEPEQRVQSGQAVAEALAALRLERSSPLVTRKVTEGGGVYGFEQDTDTEMTVEGLPKGFGGGSDEDVQTTDVFATRTELALRRVLRELAEGMCDLGCSDPALLVALAEANQVDQEIHSLEEELRELQRSDEALAQKSKEREASLRFAMGELKFDTADEGSVDTAVNVALDGFKSKLDQLTEQTQAQHASITERQIEKTALRESALEELHRVDAKLVELIDAHADEMRNKGRIAELLAERGRLRNKLDQEQADAALLANL